MQCYNMANWRCGSAMYKRVVMATGETSHSTDRSAASRCICTRRCVEWISGHNATTDQHRSRPVGPSVRPSVSPACRVRCVRRGVKLTERRSSSSSSSPHAAASRQVLDLHTDRRWPVSQLVVCHSFFHIPFHGCVRAWSVAR